MIADLSTLGAVFADTDSRVRQGLAASARKWPTGFSPLDTYLGGGLRAGELTLLGGPQGIGKTTLALQMARNIVAKGGHALYFSFEHDPGTMLEKLLVIEAAEWAGDEGMTMRFLREALDRQRPEHGGLMARLGMAQGGAEAVAAVEAYSERLHVHQSSGRTTSTDVIRNMVIQLSIDGQAPVVIVDYLQKVAGSGLPEHDDERVARAVSDLKDLALRAQTPVLAIAAAEREGIVGGKRTRIHHLAGTSILAYEADVVLMVNEKYDVVARHHLMYSTTNADRYREYAVVSIEKNRSGVDRIDLEFRKRFAQGRFDRAGGAVAEQLVDERIVVD